jgi:drug/metabolite transporter (DMT)-like permease
MLLAHSNAGIVLSLATAVFWGISPVFMASVGRRIGSYHTNLLRLLIATLVLIVIVFPVYLLLHGPVGLPTRVQLLWIVASALGGMVVGDMFFYETLVIAGARRAIKLTTLAPVFAILLAWFVNGERLSIRLLGGAALIIAAIMYATFRQTTVAAGDEIAGDACGRRSAASTPTGGSRRGTDVTDSAGEDTGGTTGDDPASKGEPSHLSVAGLCCGLVAAFCTGLGSVLQRRAVQSSPGLPLDPIVATIIRVGLAAAVMWVWPLFTGQSGTVLRHLRDGPLRGRLLGGIACGPLGGMLCYIGALSLADAGLVSTLAAASPLVTIPIMSVRYRLRIGWDVVFATVVAVAGVAVVSL